MKFAEIIQWFVGLFGQLSLAEIIQLLTLALTLAGVVLAIVGLSTWNYQLKGAYRFDLAKSTKRQISRLGRQASEIENYLSSNDYDGIVDKDGNLESNGKIIDLIIDGSIDLAVLGDLEEFNRSYKSLGDQISECNLTFLNSSNSPLDQFYQAVKFLRIDLFYLKHLVDKKIHKGNDLLYFQRVYSSRNPHRIEYLKNESIKYLDHYMNHPLSKKKNAFKMLRNGKITNSRKTLIRKIDSSSEENQ